MSEEKPTAKPSAFTRVIVIFAVSLVLFVPLHALLKTWQYDGLSNLFSWSHLKPRILFDVGLCAVVALFVGGRPVR